MDFYTQKTKVLEAVLFMAQRVFERRELAKMDCRFELLEGIMDQLALQLRVRIFAGETRGTVKTVEFKRPATWVDALQLHAESKGFLCGGGLIGLLLYWFFIGRQVRYVTETASATFKARELFPEVRSRGDKCVIADWTDRVELS